MTLHCGCNPRLFWIIMIDTPRAHLIIRVDHSKWKYNHRGYNARQDGASNSPGCSLFLLYPSMFSESIEPTRNDDLVAPPMMAVSTFTFPCRFLQTYHD